MSDTEVDEALRDVLNPPNYPLEKKTITNLTPQRLKSALWFTIGKIVDAECVTLHVNATPQFIAALTELVWAQLGPPSLPPLPWV